jgi:MOSC domain-containing protein YiiM
MRLLSVNVGVPRPNPGEDGGLTAIDKRPADGAVMVTAPDPDVVAAVGLAGDQVGDKRHHGGPDQALYAYAREDLDMWQAELDTPLRNGMFGENLTTAGVDVNGALIGERWRVGPEAVVEASCPRIPCYTFQGWMGRRGWIKRFTRAGLPGAYLRVIREGPIRADDPVEIVHRPGHEVTVALVFRALTLEPELLPLLLTADALPEEIRQLARRRTALPHRVRPHRACSTTASRSAWLSGTGLPCMLLDLRALAAISPACPDPTPKAASPGTASRPRVSRIQARPSATDAACWPVSSRATSV